MPKTHRELVRRQIAHAHHNNDLVLQALDIPEDGQAEYIYKQLNLAIDHLARAEEEFTNQHPELGEQLQVACVLLVELGTLDPLVFRQYPEQVKAAMTEVQNMLTRFCQKVWGREDTPWESWRNVRVQ